MKLILGSGIVGLFAKLVLGDDWKVIPFGRSRFYSFNPPLDDNFIVYDDHITPVITSLGMDATPVLLKRCYSLGGALVAGDRQLIDDYLLKVFGAQAPPHAAAYLAARDTLPVYNNARANKLYAMLGQRYAEELQREAAAGQVTEIGDHYIVRGRERIEFERAVTTIPLRQFAELAGRTPGVQCRPVHFVHLHTAHLDFEGASQVMVVDRQFDFYKVTSLAKHRYLFHFSEDVGNAGAFFMPILKDFDLLDGTSVGEALPLGPMPDLGWAEALGYFAVGSYAQHDWCADVGSNILRLLRYAGRDYTPRAPVLQRL